MARTGSVAQDPALLQAALEGLELQRERIDEQIRQVQNMLGGSRRGRPVKAAHNGASAGKMIKRTLSPEARKRIAAAQKRRWAKYRKSEGSKTE
jgi:hypothetical protein